MTELVCVIGGLLLGLGGYLLGLQRAKPVVITQPSEQLLPLHRMYLYSGYQLADAKQAFEKCDLTHQVVPARNADYSVVYEPATQSVEFWDRNQCRGRTVIGEKRSIDD